MPGFEQEGAGRMGKLHLLPETINRGTNLTVVEGMHQIIMKIKMHSCEKL